MLSLLCSSETTHTPQGDGNGVESILVAQDQRETTHTPQGDGNSISLLNSISFIETTHTPQGDGNIISLAPVVISSETTHTPQGDGNILNRIQNVCKKETALTPQGDGNLPDGGNTRTDIRNNPHPARGRKRERIYAIRYTNETTHTPQGDGKPFVFTLQKLFDKPFTSLTGDY